MSIIRCSSCAARLNLPDIVLGKRVRCPECHAIFTAANESSTKNEAIQATEPKETSPRLPYAERAENLAAGQTRDADPDADLDAAGTSPTKRKRKRAKKPPAGNFLARMGLPPVIADLGIWPVLGVIGGLLFVSVAMFGLMWLVFRPSAPAEIPEAQWQPFETPGRYRALLPGTPTRKEEPFGPITMVAQSLEPTRDTYFIVGHTEGMLPADRRRLPSEILLDDACNGSMANIEKMGGKELRREPIQLGNYPGKQLVVSVPRLRGQLIQRVYLVGGRLYVISCGGKGFEPGQNNVTRFFNAFEITETPAPEPATKPHPALAQKADPPGGVHPGAGGVPANGNIVRPGRTSRNARNPDNATATPVELPPLPEALPITPAPITKETAYPLPESVKSLRVGGGGRFLVLHFPKVRKLGLFDTSEAKIVRYISVSEDEAQYAAGMNKLVVYLPSSQVIQRFDLLTGKQEQVGKLEVGPGKVEAFCMGHASAGPLLVGISGQGTRLFDLEKFTRIRIPLANTRGVYAGGEYTLEGGNYWAGATGRVFGFNGNYGQPNGIKTLSIEGGTARTSSQHQSSWFVIPGPDDRHIFVGGQGIVSESVQPLPNVPMSMGPGSGYASHMYVPATHGPYYVHAQTIEPIGGRGDDQIAQGTIRLFIVGDKEPIATLRRTAVAKYGWEGLRGMGIEHSIQLIPRAKLLVIVPDTRSELRLYPMDPEAALERTGRDFLLITSSPPARFTRGKPFTYKIEAKARKGAITYAVESGPAGMTVDAKGVVNWAVPMDFAQERVDVILAVKDSAGQTTFQTCTLNVMR